MSTFEAKKHLGQNFLKNPHIIEVIMKSAEIEPHHTVVEVGPGFGILTEALLAKAKKVIAIEKDPRLIPELKERFHLHCIEVPKDNAPGVYQNDDGKLQLIHADALKIAVPLAISEPFLWVANIPYSITSPLLDHFVRDNPTHLPLRAVLLVQKEVAEKICAKAPDMNVLALHVQTFGRPQYVATVSKNNFKPIPKVDSAIIRIDFPGTEPIPQNTERYFELIHRAFQGKRKMLRGTIGAEVCEKAGVDETRRPETLSIKEWSRLASL